MVGTSCCPVMKKRGFHRRVAVIQGPAFGQDPGKGGRIGEIGGQLIDRIQ
tara:strand:- start:7 stop:156 length:150 start_codon:yes stop_codon:yes gene_type:complete